MKVLLTRPLADCSELALKITSLGLEPVIAPLLKVHYCSYDDNFPIHQAIIITSKNALKAIGNSNIKQTPIFVVGKKTAEYAKSLGFSQVNYAGQNVAELKATIAAQNIWKNFLYLSGEDITDNLQSLSDLGYNIDRCILYRTEAVKELTAELKHFLQQEELKLVLLFSDKTAQVFLGLIKDFQLVSYCKNIVIVALSKKIAQTLNALELKSCYVAEEPTEESMIKLLNRVIDARTRKIS